MIRPAIQARDKGRSTAATSGANRLVSLKCQSCSKLTTRYVRNLSDRKTSNAQHRTPDVELGFWIERWALDVERWALGVGRWALGVGRWALMIYLSYYGLGSADGTHTLAGLSPSAIASCSLMYLPCFVFP
jgi:hypothetical protein